MQQTQTQSNAAGVVSCLVLWMYVFLMESFGRDVDRHLHRSVCVSSLYEPWFSQSKNNCLQSGLQQLRWRRSETAAASHEDEAFGLNLLHKAQVRQKRGKIVLDIGNYWGAIHPILCHLESPRLHKQVYLFMIWSLSPNNRPSCQSRHTSTCENFDFQYSSLASRLRSLCLTKLPW